MVEAGGSGASSGRSRSWRRRAAIRSLGARRNVATQRPRGRRAVRDALAVAVPCHREDRGVRPISRAHVTCASCSALQGTRVLRRGRPPFADASGFHAGGTRLALESCLAREEVLVSLTNKLAWRPECSRL